MTHLLDTDSCVEYLRRGAGSKIKAKLAGTIPGSILLCSVVVGELLYGARRSNQTVKNLADVRAFCAQFVSLTFDDQAAEHYAEIRDHLAGSGRTIGPNDTMIASIAIAHGLVVVTHNVREFSRVPGLQVEDWQTP